SLKRYRKIGIFATWTVIQMPYLRFAAYQLGVLAQRTDCGFGDLCLALEHVEGLEIAVQKLACIGMAQPAGDHGRVDPAEIGGVEQVVAFVEFGKAGDL